MIEQSVFLQTEQDAVDFTAKVSKYFGDIRMDLGSFAIDAKSVLCVLGMGLGKKAKLRIYSPHTGELVREIAPYICAD